LTLVDNSHVVFDAMHELFLPGTATKVCRNATLPDSPRMPKKRIAESMRSATENPLPKSSWVLFVPNKVAVTTDFPWSGMTLESPMCLYVQPLARFMIVAYILLHVRLRLRRCAVNADLTFGAGE
jgi:hypothetical protein